MLYFALSEDSWLTKHVPLSVTIISGRPNVANSILNFSMTQLDEIMGVQTASTHFECASIATIMFFPWKGLAKSR